jgi:hypothetical protein
LKRLFDWLCGKELYLYQFNGKKNYLHIAGIDVPAIGFWTVG